ncbi:MAG: DUF1853 family protein [Marinomonas sp.]
MMISEFHHPFVRDLAWLVEGHYIEKDFDLEPYWLDDLLSRLTELDRNPDDLINAVNACKSHFLGSYFETLFSYAIKHLSSLRVVLEHFQIQGENGTLGEVDMLVETPCGQLHQFEIAIKFYLERPDLAPHSWIGPNKNDSLLKKVTRAREHQLSILETPEGLSIINEIANNRKINSSLLVFGRLYCGLKDKDDIELWLEQGRGGWIRASEFILLMSYFSHFLILKKPHWMAFSNINENFTLFSLQSAYNLVGHFLQDERPQHILLWEIGKGVKRSVFVVPDSW